MSLPLTLKSLSFELDEWRKNRTKQGRLPDDIWTKTLKLLENHSMTEVSRELRISHEQIRNKLNHKMSQVLRLQLLLLRLKLHLLNMRKLILP